MAFLATGFQESDLDKTGILISCLDAIRSHPFFKDVKEESFRLLDLHAGDRLLEVGCGTGWDAWSLASLTGQKGLVAAIDPGLSMLREAQNRSSCSVSSTHKRNSPVFARMDGRFLGFGNAVFDAVREDRALQHIEYPETVVCEMLRVLKPDGRFVLFEPDWELFIIDHPMPEITRNILNFWADQFMNGWIGRRLCRICLDHGARDLTAIPRTLILYDLDTCDQIFGIRDTILHAREAGLISKDDGEDWLSALKELDKTGRFFSSFTGFLVTGRK